MFIGNDIFSIREAFKSEHSLTARYLDKLYMASGQSYIWSTGMLTYTACPSLMAKESAYKVSNKQFGKRMYYPKQFEVKVDSKLLLPYIESAKLGIGHVKKHTRANPSLILHGMACTALGDVSVCFFLANNFIYPLAAENKDYLENINSGIASISSDLNKNQSFCVCEQAKTRIAKELNTTTSNLEIIRFPKNTKSDPTNIYFNGNKLKTNISIANDTDLVTYAFLYKNIQRKITKTTHYDN